MEIFANRACLPDGWAENVRLQLRDGVIQTVTPDVDPGGLCVDTLLPALSNLHSHSFQRAMAGMTETRAQGRDSFWSWRARMYRMLDHLGPEEVGAAAELAFVEMLEAGFAAVGEFHYLHHAPGGQLYDDPAELSARIMAAARDTGIGLTHLPVLYTQGGLDGRALSGGQQRFGNGLAQFLTLHDRCAILLRDMPADSRLGVAPHSLRAVTGKDLTALTQAVPEGPVHIHIAEQTAEVDEVLAATGARPVNRLFDTQDVGPRWCLIHATHLSDHEVARLAQSGAVAGLCPVTEANLGDGIFRGRAFLDHGGRIGVGTDSNIRISLTDELSLLEYSQRLSHRERNVLADAGGSTGARLYHATARGGAQALGRASGQIAVGHLADLVALDSQHPTLALLSPDQLLDGFVFAGGAGPITDLWSAGRHVVEQGRHRHRDAIVPRALKRLKRAMAGPLS